MLSALCLVAGLVLPGVSVRSSTAVRAAVQPQMMASPQYAKMRDLLNQWDDDEDGDSTSCMSGLELEFLAERIGECGEEQCDALLPELNELFDAVLADCECVPAFFFLHAFSDAF